MQQVNNTLTVKYPEIQDYAAIWQSMRDFTDQRTAEIPDELWLLEHLPVFTQGQAGKAEHVLCPGDIPVVQTDRGGQVTYHGPGQLVGYCLVDIRRKNLNIRELVNCIEQTLIDMLAEFKITAARLDNAPGVYVNGAKIASLGLRIRKGCSYHGFSLNVKMDLEPFTRINPCGMQKLKMVQIADFVPDIDMQVVAEQVIKHFRRNLDY